MIEVDEAFDCPEDFCVGIRNHWVDGGSGDFDQYRSDRLGT